MRLIAALLRAMRPHQWTKNLFVFAPFLFSEEWRKEGLLLRVVATFGIFCLLASGVYLLNDVRDREADRLHPLKRLRPIASGELPCGLAAGFGVAFVASGLAWAGFGLENWSVLAVCATYVAIQILYTLWLKHVVIVDVLCIASGFVLRLIAGATAAWVYQSPWILVCTIFVSLLLALCKRRHEVVTLGQDAVGHRAILGDYPPELLDQLIGAATSATLVTYALYTVDERTARAHGFVNEKGAPLPYLAASLPFVIFGVFRYLFLVYRREEGGSPTGTLLRDVPLLVNGALYAAAVASILSYAKTL